MTNLVQQHLSHDINQLIKKGGVRRKTVDLDSPFKKNELCSEHNAGVVECSSEKS